MTPTLKPLNLASLISEAQADQQNLSAVERFSELHEAGELPHQEPYYRSLLPASPPGPGQQLAFEVDLDRCTACKACVTACHNRNGLDDTEAWRMTGTLLGGSKIEPFQQTVTTACHHCADPACLNGCPVNAYEKEKDTGIVRHLDDQCIGCKYCTLTCPYDVPQYSKRLGIVRKCDMCAQRMQDGEAPACVQACPNQAIRIRVVDKTEIKTRSEQKENTLLPGTPHPEYTQPSTRYVSKKKLPSNLQPADIAKCEPEHGHPPLVAMLVLTQASVGVYLAMALFNLASFPLALSGFLIGNVGLVAALFHLGRPQYAFRAMLGIFHSWLSREIAAFSAYMGAAAATTLFLWLENPPEFVSWRLLALGAGLSGLAGVFTSVMVYHVTRRPCWNIKWSGSKFLLSSLVLGFGLAAVFVPHIGLRLALIVATALKLYVQIRQLLPKEQSLTHPETRTAWLLMFPLRPLLRAHLMLLFLAGCLMPAFGILPLLGFPLLLAGELLERHLFFTSMTAVRMPGSPTT